MSYSETVEIITMLRKAYPKFIQASPLDPDVRALLKSTTDIWHGFLHGYTAEHCRSAVMAHITENKFPPAISEIIERIKQKLDEEKWEYTDWEARSHICMHREFGIYLPPGIVERVRRFYPNFQPNPEIKEKIITTEATLRSEKRLLSEKRL